jgi:tRNA (cytidine/uridine-2'-O-)-methyltransferase
MDYWFSLDVRQHADWAAFKASEHAPKRLWLIETGPKRTIWDAKFEDGDGLVFGNEGNGSPPWLYQEFGDEHSLTIPQANTELRSLNLSTAAGVACYEALRQIGMPA